MAQHGLSSPAVMAAVERAMDGPFVVGERDCCTAVSDAVVALGGPDPMAGLREAYAEPRGARRILEEHGGWHRLVARIAARMGAVEVPVAEARPGAVGLTRRGAARGPGRRALAICVGPRMWAAKGHRGVAILADVERAWAWAR